MADKLLIRAYNVGCGDCIYVRIPSPDDGFHILIDCGKKGGDGLLKQAIEHLQGELPKGKKAGTKRLDLIVATHRHEDHLKGFNPEWFENIEVQNIWLSAAMDPKHPQAEGVRKMRAIATQAMRALMESGRALSPEVELLASLYGVSNDAADKLLMEELPAANKIKPKYVHRGQTGRELELELPAQTAIHILAPEENIDGFYLGKEGAATLKGFRGVAGNGGEAAAAAVPEPAAEAPENISAADFRVLQSRMVSNALAFAAKESSIQNNLSVVLLIEWKKRRLLFVGDAEWEGEFKDGRHNGSWNVMWEMHKEGLLQSPVDFLKIGHHGSINATPPPRDDSPAARKAPEGGIYDLLDAILPVPKAGRQPKAQAIISTEREFYNPIPECKVMVDVARRVRNTRNYGASFAAAGIEPESLWATPKAKKNKFYETYEKSFLDQPQPLRTDLEFALQGSHFVEVEIEE
ncbi:metallohydrolase [Paludibaculum fermentans]|uniref:metallohydrolase n=1 Tax=Paludibaculum fermentans TaxID=1473598 RepID=UPI003EB76E78